VYKQEEIKPYSAQGDKRPQVERMFDNIAPTYDRLNHRLSWNIDRLWRRRALKALRQFAPRDILDVATGTGDFALMAAQLMTPRRILGIDISEGMMTIGRQKVEKAQLQGVISFAKDDCEHLSLASNSFDAAISAFGIRNFAHLDTSLRELQRVVRPGGHLCIVELSTPQHFPMKQLFWLYAHSWLPTYGRLISGDKHAYEYLITSIEAFPQGETMMNILQKAGFINTSFKRYTGGICTMYMAEKPAATDAPCPQNDQQNNPKTTS